jgi:formylglycine-generating enzyme required for sulfatase activity
MKHSLVKWCWLVLLLAIALPLRADDSAAELPRGIVANNVEFVLVPAGWFHYRAGGQKHIDGKWVNRPLRQIRAWTDAFYIAKFEARGSDFARFMNSGDARHARQYFPPPENSQARNFGAYDGCAVRVREDGSFFERFPGRDLPATHLSWDLANEFAAWMGFRLPSDAEWVHAFRSRGGDGVQRLPDRQPPEGAFALWHLQHGGQCLRVCC